MSYSDAVGRDTLARTDPPQVPLGPPSSASATLRAIFAAVETVEGRLNELRGKLDELKERLGVAATSVRNAAEMDDAELKLGLLFARAQEFVDRATADAHQQAAQILANAHAEADALVAGARSHAQELIDEARRHPVLPPEALDQLKRTIDHFGRANEELTTELAVLHSTFAPDAADGHAEAVDPSTLTNPLPAETPRQDALGTLDGRRAFTPHETAATAPNRPEPIT
jgi:hypothetical protein